MHPSRRSALLICAALPIAAALAIRPARAEDRLTYRTPPPVVANILTAPRVPRGAPSVSPDGARLILPDLPSLVPIAVLAEPVDKLAGLEVLSAMRCSRGQLKAALSGFSFVTVADGKKMRARLPQDARVGRIAWSTRGDRVACQIYASGGAEL